MSEELTCVMCGSNENIKMIKDVPICYDCEHKFYNELKYANDLHGINDLVNGYKQVIEGLRKLYGVNPNDCNLIDSPRRISRATMERNFGNNIQASKDLLKVSFDSNNHYDGLISCNNIRVFSTCPHHFESISYRVDICYLANDGKCLGLSKLPRLCKTLAKSMLLQEDYTNKLLDILESVTGCIGCGVRVEGEHGCIMCRGVNMPDVSTITTSLRGVMLANPSLKTEWLQSLQNSR